MKKKQAQSREMKCDICGQLVFARGYKSHVRLMHKLKLTERTTKVTSSSPIVTQVVTEVKPKSAKKLKEPIIKPSKDLTQVEKPTQVVTQVVTEVVTQVVERQRVYTGMDNQKLALILKGILMPSISRWKAGTFTEVELKEFTRVANIQGKSLDEYMIDLEKQIPTMHPDLRKDFE